ncbi:MAG TPA: N-acetylmuramoyl-L-alanine amidase [Candidatus Limnocylindria bacterium]|jgi:N-acetylmuramoyl-L-alanine amidase|nr:N-acetylmuramoyl-L-alanine amidase [Candidatus Limnocylindria bacterium]
MFRLCLCLLLLGLWLVTVNATAKPVPAKIPTAGRPVRTTLNGRLYTDLESWAAVNGFTSRWNTRSGEMLVSNRWSRLLFKADTKRLEIDGVSVWLSYPILRGGDHLYLAQYDESATLQTLLRPARVASPKKITTIAINAGHGGKDPGNIEGSRQEKIYTLQLALEVERQLKRAGLKVVMIRDSDRFVTLEDRPAIARARGADMFVSLHYNCSPSGGEAQGIETFCLTPAGASSTNDRSGGSAGALPGNRCDRENLTLAYELHRAVRREVDLADRGVRRARFRELTLATMPAVLIEGGFMTNPDDARKIYSETGRARYATAIVDGILSYKRLVERGQPE